MKKIWLVLLGSVLLAATLLMSACDDTKAGTDTTADTETATEAVTEVATDAATETVTEVATEAPTEAPTEAATEAGTVALEAVDTLNGKTPAQVVAAIMAAYTDNYTAVNELTMDMSMVMDGVSMDMSITEIITEKRDGYNLYISEAMDGEVASEIWYVDGKLYVDDVDDEGNPLKVVMSMSPEELAMADVADFEGDVLMTIPAAWLTDAIFVKDGNKYIISATADADMILAAAEELDLSELGEDAEVSRMTVNWVVNADGTLDFAEYDIDMTMMGMDCKVYNKATVVDAGTTVVTVPEDADQYVEVAYPPEDEQETDVGGAIEDSTDASADVEAEGTEASTQAADHGDEAEIV